MIPAMLFEQGHMLKPICVHLYSCFCVCVCVCVCTTLAGFITN